MTRVRAVAGPILSFDLETQRLAADVPGGFDNADLMGLALGLTQDHRTKRFGLYRETDALALVEKLQGASVIVGHNLFGFDYRVLTPYTQVDLMRLPTVDFAQQIRQRTGQRARLDTLAHLNLGESKSADGLQAVQWFRQGEWDKLEEYAKQDVRIVTRLYELAKKQGSLTANIGGSLTDVPIECTPPTRVSVAKPVRAEAGTRSANRADESVPLAAMILRRARRPTAPCTSCGSFAHSFDGMGIVCDEDYFASKGD